MFGNTKGASAGPQKGRPGLLKSISMASGMHANIPTQGQSAQYTAKAPVNVARVAALKGLKGKKV